MLRYFFKKFVTFSLLIDRFPKKKTLKYVTVFWILKAERNLESDKT